MVPFDVRVTPEQLQVIAWTVITVLLVGGSVAFYYSWAGAARNPGAAAAIRYCGVGMWGLAAIVFATKRVIGRFLE